MILRTTSHPRSGRDSSIMASSSYSSPKKGPGSASAPGAATLRAQEPARQKLDHVRGVREEADADSGSAMNIAYLLRSGFQDSYRRGAQTTRCSIAGPSFTKRCLAVRRVGSGP